MNRLDDRPPIRRTTLRSLWRGRLASAMVSLGTVAVVILATPKLRDAVPFSWFQNAIPLWMMTALTLTGTGFWLLRQIAAEERSQPPAGPRRFRSGVFYTRQDCPLCDEAYALLLEYEEELPPLQMVDIDTHPELVVKYGTWVPVLEIDGRARFRGRISEVLLRRLVRGTEPLEEPIDD